MSEEKMRHTRHLGVRRTRREDAGYLLRIGADKLKFETPDAPAGDAEMQRGLDMETVTRTDRRAYTRDGMEGLL